MGEYVISRDGQNYLPQDKEYIKGKGILVGCFTEQQINNKDEYMEEEYSKYLINKLFSDYENNYEYEIMSYDEFVNEQHNSEHSEKET